MKEQMWQVARKDVILLKEGDVIYTNINNTNFEQVRINSQPTIQNDIFHCEIKNLQTGYTTDLNFNSAYYIPVWTEKLITGWRS